MSRRGSTGDSTPARRDVRGGPHGVALVGRERRVVGRRYVTPIALEIHDFVIAEHDVHAAAGGFGLAL